MLLLLPLFGLEGLLLPIAGGQNVDVTYQDGRLHHELRQPYPDHAPVEDKHEEDLQQNHLGALRQHMNQQYPVLESEALDDADHDEAEGVWNEIEQENEEDGFDEGLQSIDSHDSKFYQLILIDPDKGAQTSEIKRKHRHYYEEQSLGLLDISSPNLVTDKRTSSILNTKRCLHEHQTHIDQKNLSSLILDTQHTADNCHCFPGPKVNPVYYDQGHGELYILNQLIGIVSPSIKLYDR